MSGPHPIKPLHKYLFSKTLASFILTITAWAVTAGNTVAPEGYKGYNGDLHSTVAQACAEFAEVSKYTSSGVPKYQDDGSQSVLCNYKDTDGDPQTFNTTVICPDQSSPVAAPDEVATATCKCWGGRVALGNKCVTAEAAGQQDPSGASPKGLPPVKKIPEGVGSEPTRVKASTITAQPKGGAPSVADASAKSYGVTPRGALPRSPLHHLIPQELLNDPAIKNLLEKRNIDIDEFAVRISEGEHSAVHSMDYNKKWKDFFASNPKASRSDILNFRDKMRKDFKLDKVDMEPYVK